MCDESYKVVKEWNDGSPRRIEYYKNGTTTSRHRNDGPAVQEWYRNGTLKYELWAVNGKYHREDGPAVSHYHSGGLLVEEGYYLQGERRRFDEYKPSLICYMREGEIYSRLWIFRVPMTDTKKHLQMEISQTIHETRFRINNWVLPFWKFYEFATEDLQKYLLANWLHHS
jgi:hypothetical protein